MLAVSKDLIRNEQRHQPLAPFPAHFIVLVKPLCKDLGKGGDMVQKHSQVSAIHAFLYKNKLYKNTQAEICPKIKNKLRTITRLKF